MSALDRLEEFLAGLPAGFTYGTTERIQVRRLLLGLVADGQLPERLSDLKTLLAPIVCINRDQQTSFYQLFEKEFPSAQTRPAAEPTGDDPKREKELEQIALRRRILSGVAAIAAVAVIVAIGAAYHVFRETRAKPPEIVPVLAPLSQNLQSSQRSQPVTRVTGRVWTRKGLPVEGADVWIPAKHAKTGADGTFSFDYKPSGTVVPVLVGDPKYRSVISSSNLREPLKIQLPELSERPLPAVGNMTAEGEAQRFWSFGDSLASFSEASDVFAVANQRGFVEVHAGSVRSTGDMSPRPLQLALDPFGSVLAVAWSDSPVKVFKLSQKTLLPNSSLTGSSIALDQKPWGRLLAVGSASGELSILDISSARLLRKYAIPDRIQALAFRPDGASLWIAGDSWFWNASLNEVPSTTQIYPVEDGVQIAEVQSDTSGRYLMLRDRRGKVDVWDAYGQRVKTPPDWPTSAIGSGFSKGILRIASARHGQETFAFLPWAVGILPLVGSAAWLYRLRKNRARLNRISLPREMSTYSLHAPNADPPFRGPAVKKLGQEMRRRKPGLGQQLSLEASIQASARSAGFFMPVYREHTQQREFLILIEKIGRSDQQERFYRLLAEVLTTYTYVELYTFQSSPANVRDHIAGGWTDLQELAARYPEHDLWIIADPADFIDPATLLVPEWMRDMPRWRDCALLSPYRVDARLRTLLDREGIPLASSSIGGITQLLTAVDAMVTNTVEELPGYPIMLRRQRLQWVETFSPGEDALQDLLAVIEDYLGADGMLVLRACAVYPETFWKLTLWLADNLLAGSEGNSHRDGVLARVTGLPWFRQGQIPNWLRPRLVNGLQHDEERVRRMVEGFLQGVQHARSLALQTGECSGLPGTKAQFWSRETSARVGRSKMREQMRMCSGFSHLWIQGRFLLPVIWARSLGRPIPEPIG